MEILFANQQDALRFDEERVSAAVRAVLAGAGRRAGCVSLAAVDDPTIHKLNVQYLQHDYPTDVLSFALEDDGQTLEGEVVASADTAIANAAEYGWPAEHELLLYFVHGALHLVGYRDKTPEQEARMREAEAACLAGLGIAMPRGAGAAGAANNTKGTAPR
ncbi:MAG: rRNA maturation RNase YbeY [Planctomycetota bacterium]